MAEVFSCIVPLAWLSPAKLRVLSQKCKNLCFGLKIYFFRENSSFYKNTYHSTLYNKKGIRKIKIYRKKFLKCLADSEKGRTFASANEKQTLTSTAKVVSGWPVRLSVRTRDFHSLKRSSTLLGTTKLNELLNNWDGKSQIICKKNPSGGKEKTPQQILR